MDLRYGALARSVTAFPLKTRFIITFATILKFFVNTTLKFTAIIDGKLNLTLKVFSKGHVIYTLAECPVFERLDFKPDKIYPFTPL